MAAINVKVKTDKVVAALEAKLATLKADKEAHADALKKYEVAATEYKKKVLEVVISKIPDTVQVHRWNRWAPQVELNWNIALETLPAEPEKPVWNSDTNMIPEIEAAIRLLKMTDEPTVNASTFKQISKFL
jgi:hypothetical protein